MAGISLTVNHRVTDTSLRDTATQAKQGDPRAQVMLEQYCTGLDLEFHNTCRKMAKVIKFMEIAGCKPSNVESEIEYYSRWV